MKSEVEITAIYYPGTEHMPEWDMIAQTCPERKPLLGWYDEGNPEAIDWQIKWAVEHGITSFCVDWYWNRGSRRLEHWIKGFYKARFRRHLKWFMMYANHNQPGSHSTADQIAVTKYWIDNYFKTPEYYTIDGKPAVCVWSWENIDRDFVAEAAERGETLVEGEGVKRAFAISEKLVREAGLPGIYWIDMWRTTRFDSDYAKKRVEQGYRAAIHYGIEFSSPDLSPEALKPGDTKRQFSYDAVVATAPKLWEELSLQEVLPYWVILPTGWDDRPRSFAKNSRIIRERTPEKFADLCRRARTFCDRQGKKHVVILPINEWQEGSYIEPNEEYGFGMYDAIRDAFCKKPAGGWPKNIKPSDVGLGPYDFPPMYQSPVQSWAFDDSTEHWYRQPYGGGEVECHDGCLTFVVNILNNFNVRQRLVPFAADRYAGFRVRMKVTPNARAGLGGTKNPTLRIKWGTEESPIIGTNLVVDARSSMRIAVATDGEWHEYEFRLSNCPDWKGKVNELWFEAANIQHARVAVDWMKFLDEEELVQEKSVILAESGKTDYIVVCPAEASNETRFSAFDLTNQLKRVTGADFPLVFGAVPLGAEKTIELGTPRATMALQKWLALRREESHAWELVGGRVLIAGVGARGTAYGVYAFLEKEIGCHWLTAWGDEHYPRRPTLKLSSFSSVRTPGIGYRWLLAWDGHASDRPNGALFAWRNGLNMLDTQTFRNIALPTGCEELRPRLKKESYAHTLFNLIPPVDTKTQKGYFGKHPEWFTYSKKAGERVKDRQLCMSNPELRAEFSKNFIALADKWGDGTYYDVSAMDVGGPLCECEACSRLVDKYGCPGAPLFELVAEVAKLLKDKQPHSVVATALYRRDQTQSLPNESFPQFPENVVGVFAPIDSDFSKDYAHPNNAADFSDLHEWCNRLYHTWTWYYAAPYEQSPYSGMRRWSKDLAMSAEVGLDGCQFEHNMRTREGFGLADMRTWAVARHYMEPELDIAATMREFARHYYGPVADDVLAYAEDLEMRRERSSAPLAWNKRIDAMFTPENYALWHRLFAKMELRVANKPDLLQRVRECRANLDFATLGDYKRISKALPDFADSADAIRDRFTNTLARAISRRYPGAYQKNYYYKSWMASLQTAYISATANPRPLPSEFDKVAKEDLIEVFSVAGRERQRYADPEAAIGIANHDPLTDGEDVKMNPFLCGFYDAQTDKTLVRGAIRREDMAVDRYKFYKVGRVRLTQDCMVWIGHSWRSCTQLGQYYTPGTDDQWDLYVSIKFEGPGYSSTSRSKANHALHDRVVLVRVKD